MPSTIGIIYPPPEVRSIVDKTATFVARNGPEFEEKIRLNELNNAKFNFLNPTDPYHAYYQHKVKEIAEGKQSTGEQSSAKQQQLTKAASQSDLPSNLQKLALSAKTQDTQSRIIEQMIILKDPPSEFEFIMEAPAVSPLDLDVIKLTAQFVARNGRPFLTNLMGKEQRNPMFDFLKPQHSHFNYFTKLVDQYTKILLPPRDLLDKMKKEVSAPHTVMRTVQYRVEWEKAAQREKAREDELAEKERVAYAQIDWHDFVVVETVDFQPNEQGNFPPPTTPQDVGARVIAQERVEASGLSDASLFDLNNKLLAETIIADESRVTVSQDEPAVAQNQVKVLIDKNVDQVAMDEESDDDQEAGRTKKADKSADVTPHAPNPANVIIRKDYDPKAAKPAPAIKKTGEEYFKSPLTGELIPGSMMSEHLRISMLDPRWLEQKQKEKKDREEQEEVLATGINIEKNLKRLAEYRSDMFGTGAEETLIGKKKGDEEKKREEIASWDGHSNTMELTTKRAMSGITVEDQIKAIHQSQGLIEEETSSKIGPAIPKPPGMGNNQQQPPMPNQQMMMMHSSMQPRPPTIPQMPKLPSESNMPLGGESNLDEPSAKKLKTGEDLLIAESEFLAQYGSRGPVKFYIQCPQVPDKPEWNLNGQIIALELELTETVSTIKNRLMDQLTMPIAKQKLQLESMFIKDTNTLAFYNFTPETVIHLQLKERGGRKK